MRIWWTDLALRQYDKYWNDPQVKSTFDDLIQFFAESPNRGARVGELLQMDDPGHRRVNAVLREMNLPVDARIVYATVAPPPVPNPPPVLAVAVHTASVPEGVAADHSLLVLGVIPRQVAKLR